MDLFEFYNPVKYVLGRGKLEQIGSHAVLFGKKALIVTYPSARSVELSKRVADYLKSQGVESVLFCEVPPNPLNSTVRKGADVAAAEKCDMVVGLGGGSALDSAKGIAFLAGKEGDIFDYIYARRSGSSALPILAITTTAGTGSEGNCTAVFTDAAAKDKKGLVNPLIFPKAAILDPELMSTLPKKLIAGPGLDALFHAFESYISRKSSPMSRMYSRQAMELSVEFLPKVYKDPKDLDSWDKVVLANTLAGIAIGAAACTMPHAIGQPVGGLLNKAHSDTLIAVYLPFMRYTAPHAEEQFTYLAGLLGCDTSKMSVGEAARKSPEYMQAFFEKLETMITLSDLGVEESHIDWLAETATKNMGVVLANNPVVPDIEMVKTLYRQAL